MGILKSLGVKNGFTDFLGDNRNMMTALGTGLMTGQNFGDGLSNAAQLMPAARRADDAYAQAEAEKAQRLEALQRNAAAIRQMGIDFAPIADAMTEGGLDVSEGFNTAFRLKSQMREQEQLNQKNRTNSVFLKDPSLRDAVATGAMSFADAYRYEKGGADGAGKTSMQPTWGVDTDPNSPTYQQQVLGQLNDGGQFVRTELPPGIQAMGPGALAGERTGATVDAKTAAAARAALPTAQQALAVTRQSIDMLRNDEKGQAEQFGKFLGIYPQQWTGATPGSDKANFRNNLGQAGGQAFMQARQMLKGGGQITDYEGRRGEAAYSRMQAAADSGDQQAFLTALDDFEQAVEAGYQKLQQAAQGGYSAGALSGSSATDYRSKYGLE